jgi:hypothetical protein
VLQVTLLLRVAVVLLVVLGVLLGRRFVLQELTLSRTAIGADSGTDLVEPEKWIETVSGVANVRIGSPRRMLADRQHVAVCVLLLQCFNLFHGASWPYLVGVMSLLGMGFLFFATLMFNPDALQRD